MSTNKPITVTTRLGLNTQVNVAFDEGNQTQRVATGRKVPFKNLPLLSAFYANPKKGIEGDYIKTGNSSAVLAFAISDKESKKNLLSKVTIPRNEEVLVFGETTIQVAADHPSFVQTSLRRPGATDRLGPIGGSRDPFDATDRQLDQSNLAGRGGSPEAGGVQTARIPAAQQSQL